MKVNKMFKMQTKKTLQLFYFSINLNNQANQKFTFLLYPKPMLLFYFLNPLNDFSLACALNDFSLAIIYFQNKHVL